MRMKDRLMSYLSFTRLISGPFRGVFERDPEQAIGYEEVEVQCGRSTSAHV